MDVGMTRVLDGEVTGARIRGLSLVVGLFACGPGPAASSTTGTTTAGTTGADATATGETTGPGTTAGATDSSTTSSTGTGDTGTTGCVWLCPEADILPPSCNPWDPRSRDCPRGYKCTAFDSDDDGGWDANRCVPVTGDGGHDDPCTTPAGPAAGDDDCAPGFLCWGVDPETLIGHCVQFCSGNPEMPMCPSGHNCVFGGFSILPLCLDVCHPLVQNCPEGEACGFSDVADFVCLPNNSGGRAPPGTPCMYYDECNPGSLCINTQVYPHPDCAGSFECCAPFCDLNDPMCPAEPPGLSCEPWYDPGTAPAGYEDVGICFTPP